MQGVAGKYLPLDFPGGREVWLEAQSLGTQTNWGWILPLKSPTEAWSQCFNLFGFQLLYLSKKIPIAQSFCKNQWNNIYKASSKRFATVLWCDKCLLPFLLNMQLNKREAEWIGMTWCPLLKRHESLSSMFLCVWCRMMSHLPQDGYSVILPVMQGHWLPTSVYSGSWPWDQVTDHFMHTGTRSPLAGK